MREDGASGGVREGRRTTQPRYDVAVIGAGPAGVTAASGAARGGASVLLVDSSNRLGGAVTAAMHRSLCGLYSREPRDPLDVLNPGAQRDAIERMIAHAPSAVRPRQLGKAWVLEFPTAAWEAALGEIASAPGIDRVLETRVTSVRRDARRVTAIQMNGAADRWIDINALIDCTGGGSVLQLIGEDVMQPVDPSQSRMLGGFAVRLTGLTGDVEMLRIQVPYVLARAVADGKLPPLARFTVFSPGPQPGEGVCKLAVQAEGISPGEVELFAQQIIEHLMREVEGFAIARVVEQSPHALPRDGRCLRGKMQITEDDVLTARRHGANAVHAWWPIERWDASQGPSYTYPPAGQHYDIPDDALRSAVVENLFAAGSCLSATPGAAASLRVSGICLATGDAAGRIAASMTHD
jgi:hypothetical protein